MAETMVGDVVGWAQVYKYVLPETNLIAEVGGIVIDKNHRSQGIGKKLIDNIERWARENGSATVTIRSNVIRSKSHRFYKHLGYAVVKKQIVFCRKQTG